MRSFWGDVDAGEGKPYASADIAIQAVDAFAEKLGLPYPILVRSGSGVHVYWPLTRDVTAAEWLPVAKLLKQVAAQCGLHADPSRTADPASILRPPGTYNRKSAPRPVEAQDDEIELISIEDFAAKLKAVQLAPVATVHASAKAGGILASVLASQGSSSVENGVAKGGRNNACASYAGKLFTGGRHTFEQGLAAVLEMNKKNQPPLDEAEVVATVKSIWNKEQSKPAPPPIIIGNAEFARPLLPEGYSAAPGGAMYANIEDGEGKPKNILIAYYECYLTDVCRKENEPKESYVFTAYHPHAGWHRFLVRRDEFEGASWLGIMGLNCTDVGDGRYFKSYVKAAAVKLKKDKMDSVTYSQFGWKDDRKSFLIGNSLICEGGKVEYAFGDPDLEARMPGFKILPNTTREAWSVAGNKLYAPGFEAVGFALAASFGAIFMPFVCGQGDGGAVLSLFSKASGLGKSNTCQAVASVWGDIKVMGLGGAATTNAKFNVISKNKNIPVIVEELSMRDHEVALDFLKRFMTGKDKERSRRDGSVEYKDTSFQTILICTGNDSLAELIRASGDQGAMARLFEIAMPEPADKVLFNEFNRICDAMSANRGHAGREFVYRILSTPGLLEWTVKQLDAHVEYYKAKLETTPKDRYIVYLLACTHVASKLVNAFGILEYGTDRIMNWGVDCATDRIANPMFDTATETLNQFISEHMQECVVVEHPWYQGRTCNVLRWPTGRVLMRLEQSNMRLYIPVKIMRSWLAKSHGHLNTLALALFNEGVITNPQRTISLGAGTIYPSAQLQCWEIDMSHSAVSGQLALVEKLPLKFPRNITSLNKKA